MKAQNMNKLPLTEQRNPDSQHLDQMSIGEMIQLMNQEDLKVTQAVGQAKPAIEACIQDVVNCFESGGRLFYIGAGTSGRLGVLDASECPPTFSVSPELVQGVIAGGLNALHKAAEGAEDREEQSHEDLKAKGFGPRDFLVGIASSGTTPYVREALRYAKSLQAKTALLACTEIPQNDPAIDHYLLLLVGPEIVTGSTRMKAGTATKMVLNMISTISMVRLGKVYGNLMVDVTISNQKLVRRALRMVQELTGLDDEKAQILLDNAQGQVKTAVLMHLKELNYEEASHQLKRSNGFLRQALHV